MSSKPRSAGHAAYAQAAPSGVGSETSATKSGTIEHATSKPAGTV